MVTTQYTFRVRVWLYPRQAGWHFVTLPKKQSREMKKTFGDVSRGWGSLPIIATIGTTTWKTSIFPDKKASAYLLSVKADVRKREVVAEGDAITLTIEIKA